VEKIEALRTGDAACSAAIAAYEQNSPRGWQAIQNAPSRMPGHWASATSASAGDYAVRQQDRVDEELSQLASHLAEMRRILTQGGAVGKRSDF
jgi:hypothetical protein